MKSTLKLFAMLMLVTFMASCSEGSDELGTTQPTGKKVYMTFSGSTDPTLRTVINSEDNSKIDFEAGDAISVFDVKNANNKFTTEDNGSKAEFGGEVTEKSESYAFLYPYQEGASFDGSNISAVIPAEQVATVGTFDPAANLSVATGDEKGGFQLKNVCSLIRLNVAVNCASVTLTDLDGRTVAGAVTIDPTTGKATEAGGASKSVTLKDLEAGNVYYIALLPGAIKLNLKFMTTDGKSFVRTKNDEIDLGRSKVLNIGKITAKESEMTQEWVDLGLPSGTLWATCNVGATSPEKFGNYYAWGEIEPKPEYGWKYQKYTNSEYSETNTKVFTKYCPLSDKETYWAGEGEPDNKLVLDPEDDAATVNLGNMWRTPTYEECLELIENTTVKSGTGFYTLTSKVSGYTNKSIILPIAGYKNGTGGSNSNAYLWTSSLNTARSPWRVYYNGTSWNTTAAQRIYGFSIRPVYVKKAKR